MSKVKGKEVPELEMPKFPESLRQLWYWFLELYTGETLSYGEIHSWSRLTKRNLTREQVLLIRILDATYRKEYFSK